MSQEIETVLENFVWTKANLSTLYF